MKDNYKKFIDPNIKRKSDIIQNSLQFDRSNKIPLFSLVEISDSGTCNRACSFCPRSNKAKRGDEVCSTWRTLYKGSFCVVSCNGGNTGVC